MGAGRGRRAAGARTSRRHPGTTLFAIGMGPNQFFNNDNKDRDIFLLAALTGNVGKIAGNVGSYAGNYRIAHVQRRCRSTSTRTRSTSSSTRPKPARPKQYWKAESAHYYNHEDHPLKVGNKMLTGKTHMPDADQVDVVRQRQLDPRQREVALQHGRQRAAEDRDDRRQRVVVVDVVRVGRRGVRRRLVGGAEVPRHDRVGDQSVPAPSSRARRCRASSRRAATSRCCAIVGDKMAELTGDKRFRDCWKFVARSSVGRLSAAHPQRARRMRKGYRFAELEEKAKKGIPGADDDAHRPEGRRLRAGHRLAALVHEDRAARVLPRGGRVHRGRREPAGAPRADRLDVLRAERHRRAEARGAAADGPERLRRGPERPVVRGAPGPQRRADVGRDEADAASAGEGRIPVRLPHAEVPPRRAHHADRHRHGRDAVRAVRRHLPARQAHAVRRRRLRRHQSRRTPRRWASRTATTSGSTRIRPTGRSAAGRRTTRTTSSRASSAGRATTRARRAA